MVLAAGLLAALALAVVPGIQDRLAKGRTRAAIDNIDRLVRASAVYVSTPLVDTNGLALPCQFPASTPVTPAESCCGYTADGDGDGMCDAKVGAWDGASWKALDFLIAEPHYFVYAYESHSQGGGAEFVARAHGDLDCDGQLSTFSRSGRAVLRSKEQCTLRLSPAFTIIDRLE